MDIDKEAEKQKGHLPSNLVERDERVANHSTQEGEKGGEEKTQIVEGTPDDEGALSIERLASIIESILFVSKEPVMRKVLQRITGAKPQEIKEALEYLDRSYQKEERGIRLMKIAEGFLLTTKVQNAPYVSRFLPEPHKIRLSRSALESLAIVAYNQPVTKGDIEAVRGVDSSGIIRTLLEKGMIKVLGRKDAPGRPILYGTTVEFLKVFGLEDLSHLPSIEEIKAMMMEEGGSKDGEIEIFKKEVEIPMDRDANGHD